jgi:hypothetical protein
MTLRRVTAVASDNSRRCYRKAAVGFRTLRDNPPLPAFTSFPSSFHYDVTSRRGIRLCQGYDVTRAATVALGGRTRGHCALSAMLTVSQLSKSFAGRALFDDVPLRVNRGVPIGASAMLSSKIMKSATLKVYKGAPHGMATTLKHEVNAELLSFIQGKAQAMQPNR